MSRPLQRDIRNQHASSREAGCLPPSDLRCHGGESENGGKRCEGVLCSIDLTSDCFINLMFWDDRQYIQLDFVHERAQGSSKPSPITPDDLRLRMNIARYVHSRSGGCDQSDMTSSLFLRILSLTYHGSEVTESMWDKVKALDDARKARLSS